MVPAHLVQIQQWPLTPNGKIDRKRLPLPEPDQHEETEGMAPQTETEKQVAAIWSEILGHPIVSREANFFALGGHSLLATQVVVRMRERFQMDLPLRVLFEYPTIEGLALFVQQAAELTGARESTRLPAIQAGPRPEALPLSFAQQRLWFLDQLQPGSVVYSIPIAVRFKGKLDDLVLEHALQEIVQRHEVLRTTFVVHDQQVEQQIETKTTLALQRVNLESSEEDLSPQILLQTMQQVAQRPFDLSTGPLLRAVLYTVREDEHIFLLNMHHIISDGWSLGVLVKELVALYEYACGLRKSQLPPLTIQYADYTRWQQDLLREDIIQEQLAYWREQLAGVTGTLDLPTRSPHPHEQRFAGARVPFSIPPALVTKLKDLSQEHGVTLFMTLLTAFQLLLHRYSQQEDIVVGTPIANRTQADVEALIGCFVNTLVLRSCAPIVVATRPLLNCYNG
jgi:acyl carrier protein